MTHPVPVGTVVRWQTSTGRLLDRGVVVRTQGDEFTVEWRGLRARRTYHVDILDDQGYTQLVKEDPCP